MRFDRLDRPGHDVVLEGDLAGVQIRNLGDPQRHLRVGHLHAPRNFIGQRPWCHLG